MNFIHYLLLLGYSATTSVVISFSPQSFSVRSLVSTASTLTLTRLQESSALDVPDYAGKTIYQRTFYRLKPVSTVSYPNALVIEERLRYKPDPDKEGYILPYGPRTFIFRKGTDEDRITEELYRINLGNTKHNGPGTMDTAIATMLYLASNPEIVQGDILELSCENGAASLIGCIGARLVLDPHINKQKEEELDIMTVPKHADIFPKRMHHLTLSEEGQERLRDTYDSIKGFANGKVSLKDIPWSTRIPGRRYGTFYRLIVGSDIDFSYPNSKELARTIANHLLPSNEFAVSNIKGVSGGTNAGGGFGAMGMDIAEPSPTSGAETEREVDPKVPATFVHVCPDTRESSPYLRQYLEKGFRMTVNTGYLKMERLQFVFQALPEDQPEATIEDLDLELKDETFRSYQSLKAVHHPDYSGEGTGEYFFPLETGEYEGGSRGTYLEPEEGRSPW
jgi:hypothetical protein